LKGSEDTVARLREEKNALEKQTTNTINQQTTELANCQNQLKIKQQELQALQLECTQTKGMGRIT
jgi:uncharacterized protein HemX